MRNGNVGFAFSVFLFTVFYFLGYACNILFSMRFFFGIRFLGLPVFSYSS